MAGTPARPKGLERSRVMARTYHYVGPVDIHARAKHAPPGVRVQSVQDLNAWVRSTGQQLGPAGRLPVTFVIDESGCLRVADRGSEHIACSGGQPVLSAGELFLSWGTSGPEVVEVSNQSTGFCPEPESWPAVAAALDRVGIRHPGQFTHEVIFRRCLACGERNIVKDGWFVCCICGRNLPQEWNF